MDALYTAGIRFAEVLQSGPPWLEKFWISVTSRADPKCAFTVCFPLAYFLNRNVTFSCSHCSVVSFPTRFLFGERPFWWVHQSGLASKELVTLHQFPVSCETGPGDPSGHCMITGAALWPLVTELTKLASQHSRSPVLKLIPFGAYILLLVAVGLSRIFVLAHFPHQVVSGILAGAALGWWLQTHNPISRPPGFFAAAALGLLLSSLTLHNLLTAAGIDIDW
ncbi:G6PC3 phosphatase, partial [Psilopogon haemacephalus]|nr:G6PC3 phosphatase [Psilopogon haemacephalus]